MTAEKMWQMSGLEGEYEAWAFGGDADTQAAITGGIIAACSPVPEHILNPCVELLDPPLVDVIEQFNAFIGQKSYLE